MENLIPYYRREKRIKQSKMARDINVSPSYLCKVEKGLMKPTDKFIKICSTYLNVSPAVLFPKKIETNKINNFQNGSSNKLWNVRLKKGIKQYELAKNLKCSPSYLSRVEKGLQKPSVSFKKKCAKILRIKMVELFS